MTQIQRGKLAGRFWGGDFGMREQLPQLFSPAWENVFWLQRWPASSLNSDCSPSQEAKQLRVWQHPQLQMHSELPFLVSRLRISIATQQYEGCKEQPPFTGLKQFLAVSLRESSEALVTCGALCSCMGGWEGRRCQGKGGSLTVCRLGSVKTVVNFCSQNDPPRIRRARCPCNVLSISQMRKLCLISPHLRFPFIIQECAPREVFQVFSKSDRHTGVL